MNNLPEDIWHQSNARRAGKLLIHHGVLAIAAAIIGVSCVAEHRGMFVAPEHVSSAASNIRNDTHQRLEEAVNSKEPAEEGMVVAGESR